jgi:methionine biosynthesis protein MetW
MAELRDRKSVDARGIEISGADVTAALQRGLSVIQGDADTDLADYPDASFDYAVLSQTLQTTRRPDLVIDQLLRIGERAFVSFPNFAQWRIRLALMFGGRMPITKQLPDRWYDTPNIHHVTIDDFRGFLSERGVRIERQWFLRDDRAISSAAANIFAEHAVFLLSRQSAP